MSGSIVQRLRRPEWRSVLVAFLLLVGCGELAAHKVAPDPTVEVFLRSTGDHLAVKVWLPIIALADANLPRTSDGHFKQDEIRPALDVVARGMARDLELQEADVPLSAPTATTTLSPDESFVAIDLDYPVPAGRTDLSGRFHTFRGNGQIIATQVHYVVDDRQTRTYVVDAQAERIAFTPGVLQVLQHFIATGSNVLFEGADFLLLGICLIAVARDPRTMAVAMGAVLAGQAIVIVLAARGVMVLSSTALNVLAGLAASTTVVLAIQDVTSPQSRWLPLLCFAFGTLSGAAIGARLLHEWGFTGGHALTAVTGFLATVSIGEVWALALLWSAAGLIRRRGRVAALAVLSTAIFAGHAALHRVVDLGQMLADAGSFTLDRFLFTVTVAWGVLILSAGMLGTLGPARAADQRQLGSSPGNLQA